MKERILISQDNSLFNDICSDLIQFQEPLNILKKHYEALEIGTFTDEVYKEIVLSGLSRIADTYRKSIVSEINRTGVTKTLVKENIVFGAETILNQFLDYAKELKRFKPETYSREKRLSLKHISFTKKGFAITADDKESILEDFCRIYLETEEEHVLHEDLTKFIEAFEVIDKYLKDMKIQTNPMASRLSYLDQYFLKLTEGKYEIRPDAIRFVLNRISYVETESIK